ncbi:MAG TPA: DUF3662 and FHA domain-containing protein [Candidatus Acidoferrum sp.]|nr:DUF3662 and FHA domain-containing protein [Candidatus Acidoferrum sp.]
MRPFAAVERLIERLIERPSARLFRTRVQPLQLQRRIERAMETNRRSAGDRTIVPNRYAIRLNPADMSHLEPVADSLAAELADSALLFARTHRLFLADRPRVELHANRAVAIGDIVVEARFDEAGAAVASGGSVPRESVSAATPSAGAGAVASTGVDDGTAVFRVPQPTTPLAVLRELRQDGRGRSIVVDGRPLTLGRANDNDVVLGDGGVSRHHARLQGRGGALILTDLQSRNGSRVNGVTVTEVVLGPGDRIQLGETVLVVDVAEA